MTSLKQIEANRRNALKSAKSLAMLTPEGSLFAFNSDPL
jgi:hypothetical protein